MFCSHCGSAAADGARFCGVCGTALGAPNSGAFAPQAAPGALPPGGQAAILQQPRGTRAKASPDPRKQQLRALKLELRRLRIEMQQVNAQLGQIRGQYQQGSPFVPWGLGHRIFREVENIEILGPQQHKQALQQQIIQLEQQILALESQMSL
jgi:hypothetical protein